MAMLQPARRPCWWQWMLSERYLPRGLQEPSTHVYMHACRWLACMHVVVHACAHVRGCTLSYVHACVHGPPRLLVPECMHVHVHMYAHMCMRICVHICACVCSHACMHACMRACVRTCVRARACAIHDECPGVLPARWWAGARMATLRGATALSLRKDRARQGSGSARWSLSICAASDRRVVKVVWE